jgi:hypothetical protein
MESASGNEGIGRPAMVAEKEGSPHCLSLFSDSLSSHKARVIRLCWFANVPSKLHRSSARAGRAPIESPSAKTRKFTTIQNPGRGLESAIKADSAGSAYRRIDEDTNQPTRPANPQNPVYQTRWEKCYSLELQSNADRCVESGYRC